MLYKIINQINKNEQNKSKDAAQGAGEIADEDSREWQPIPLSRHLYQWQKKL